MNFAVSDLATHLAIRSSDALQRMQILTQQSLQPEATGTKGLMKPRSCAGAVATVWTQGDCAQYGKPRGILAQAGHRLGTTTCPSAAEALVAAANEWSRQNRPEGVRARHLNQRNKNNLDRPVTTANHRRGDRVSTSTSNGAPAFDAGLPRRPAPFPQVLLSREEQSCPPHRPLWPST